MVGFLCTTLGNGVRPRSGVSANHSTVCFSMILHWNLPRICLCFSTMYLGTGNLDGLGVFGTAVCAAALFSISPQGLGSIAQLSKLQVGYQRCTIRL